MPWVFLEAFQHEFVGPDTTVTARLSRPPESHWVEGCRGYFERFAAAFGAMPVVDGQTVVVQVTTHELPLVEEALRQVIFAANWELHGEGVEVI